MSYENETSIEEDLTGPVDREVIPPAFDEWGRLLPIYRVWMRDGYTGIYHGRTPGEACSKAIELVRSITSGVPMNNREKRLADRPGQCLATLL